MPRTARIKNTNGIYHIMVRSSSDFYLFKDTEDKNKYLEIIKKYQDMYIFKIYSYCLMNTHAHFIIDCNGADISKIMKSINQSYSLYFNKRYDRHGHVFQDRFKSKLIENNKYLIVLSSYIHNNAKDLNKYKENVEKYPYSSLGIYLGLQKDIYKLVDTTFILNMIDHNPETARKSYLNIFNHLNNKNIEFNLELEENQSEFNNERHILIRNFNIKDITSFVSNYIGFSFNLNTKNNHKNNIAKSICIAMLRSLCNLNYKDICHQIGNMTLSNAYKLSQDGINLLTKDNKYKSIIPNFIACHS